jgi:rieske iron-sulfur protein
MSDARRVGPGHASVGQPEPGRRAAVRLLVASGAAAVLATRAGSAGGAPAPDKAPPAPGDGFVFAEGARKGQPVTPADLPPGGPMVSAWARDPASGTVRSGSRLHRVLLLRLDPAGLDPRTRERAAEGGIVAYSGFCTHAGCPVQHWKADEQVIRCHCHESEFDPRAGGKVVGGPARRPLAGLPVRLDGDRLVVAGEFAGKLGPPKA